MSSEIKKDTGLFGQFTKHAEHAKNSLDEWRENAKVEFEFAAGKQWSDEQLSALKQSGKPGLVFNQVHRVLSAVAGSEIINRFEPRYLRRTMEDQGGADVATAWTRFHRGECDAQHEESKAFMDTLVCGVGCTETYMDYRDDPNGVVTTERVPIHDMMWDPSATQQNFKDAQFCYRGKWVPEEEFNEAFDQGGELISSYRTEFDPNHTGSGRAHDASRAWQYLPDPRTWINHQRKEVLVVDYQYKKDMDGRIFYLPDGTLEFEFEDRIDELRDKLGQSMGFDIFQNQFTGDKPFEGQPERAPCYYSVTMSGDNILEETKLPYRDFTYKFITGFEDRSARYPTYFGLMRLMKDPQDWANKFLSQLIHIIGTNPKGAVIVGPNTFDNENEARRQWARPDGFIKASHPEFKNQIEILPTGNMPQAAMGMFTAVSDMVSQSAGVNMAYFAGQSEDLRRTAAHSVDSVKNSAAAVLSPLFDSFKRHRKSIGRLYLRFMREHAQVNQLVRIAGPPLEQYAQMSATQMFQRYDVVIDESPVSANSPQEVWKTLTDQGLLMHLLEAGIMPREALPLIIPNLAQPVRDMMTEQITRMVQQEAAAAQAGQPPVVEGEPTA